MISTHEYAATLNGTVLPIIGGRIILDDGQSPHVQASITIPFPSVRGSELVDDPLSHGFDQDPFGWGPFGGVNRVPTWAIDTAKMADLDPRKTLRVMIDASVTTDDYTHIRVFNLGFRDRSAVHADGTITLTLASDEALLSDWAPLTDDKTPASLRDSIRAICNYVLGRIIPGATLSNHTTADHSFRSTNYEPDALTWKAGQSGLAFLVPLVQSAGMRLVCDELRGWTLRTADYVTGGGITIRHAENVIDAADGINRDGEDWFDAAVTHYRWEDGSGTHERTDSYALRSAYRRVRVFERDTPYPGAGFSAYAVRRAQRRGREVAATTVADWRVHAEMPVVLDLEATPTLSGRIGRVEYDLDRDEMTVTARTIETPDTAWQFLPVGETWSDSPPGASWTGEAA